MYAELQLSPALEPLGCVWANDGSTGAHRVLPDGCIDILIAPGGHARVVGTMTRAIVVPSSSDTVLGIRFRPGEAARLLPAASRELTDRDAPLVALWGSGASSFEDAILEVLERASRERCTATEIVARAREAVEQSLGERLAAHGDAVDQRVRAAAKLLGEGASVRAVAERVALSERQLSRRFTARVGVSPKTFSRVMRLQAATRLLDGGMPPSQVAAVAGYTDQSHLTRDAGELAGISPRALARERAAPPSASDSSKTPVAPAS